MASLDARGRSACERAGRVLAAVPGASALLRDSSLAGAAAVVSRAYLFALNVITSRLLGDSTDFGRFSWAWLTIQVVGMFTGLGLAQAAAQGIAAELQDGSRRAVCRSIVNLLAAASAGALLVAWVAGPRLVHGAGVGLPAAAVQAGALLLAAQVLTGGMEGVLRGLGRFRAILLASVMAAITGLVLVPVLVTRAGSSGALAAAACAALVQLVALGASARDAVGRRGIPAGRLKEILGRTAAPTFATAMPWNLGMMVPPLLLARAPGGLAQLGLWNAASQIRFLISFAPVVVANAAIPRLSRSRATGVGWPQQAWTSLGLTMAVALIGFVPTLLLGEPLLRVFGPAYGGHGELVRWVALFVLLQVLGTALYVVLLADGGAWPCALLNGAWSIATVFLTAPVIERAGVDGLAMLYAGGYALVLAVLLGLAARVLIPRDRSGSSHVALAGRRPRLAAIMGEDVG